MENNNLCKLCYSSNKQIINIFDNNGIELNIAQILKKHFWFKVIEKDVTSNVICNDCWWKTKNFHNFYNEVIKEHNNYLNISYKTNDLFRFKTKSIIKDSNFKSSNIDIKFIKVENIDEDSNEIPCDTIIINQCAEESAIIKDEKGKHKSIVENDSNDNHLQNNYDSGNDDNYSTFETNNRLKVHAVKKRKSKVDYDETIPRRKTINDNLSNPSKIVKKQNNERKSTTISKSNTNELKCKTNSKALEKKLRIDKEDAQIREYFIMECEICNYKFSTILEGKIHYRENHNIKGFLTCCKRKFYRRSTAIEHIVQHINPEAYKCHFCNKCYTDKEQLSNHIRNHVSFEDKPYKCDMCPKRFIKYCYLNYHKRNSHCTEEDKKFSCDVCNKSFITKYYLATHIRGVHENAFVFICDICARVFKSKAVLVTHRESHFGVEESPKLQCNICGKWLKCKSSLRAHIVRHKDTKHTCPQCGKVSANGCALKKHISCVHSDKTHTCKLCNKEFKQAISLKEHMATHTGEALYTCLYCPKTFNSGANMRSHRKKMHPVEWQENRGQRVTEIQNI